MGWLLLCIFRHCPVMMHINGTCQGKCPQNIFINIIIFSDLKAEDKDRRLLVSNNHVLKATFDFLV